MPVKWLSELFDKYVPECIAEMRRNYSHITPLGGRAAAARAAERAYVRVPWRLLARTLLSATACPPVPPRRAGTMNLVTTLVNTLEGLLKPENLSNKADQVRRPGRAAALPVTTSRRPGVVPRGSAGGCHTRWHMPRHQHWCAACVPTLPSLGPRAGHV